MNKYEAMVIFPEALKDAQLEEALNNVRAEIKKLGGEVESTTRLGRRAFARKLKKLDAGHYLIVTFKLGPDQVTPLLARFKLNEQVFRVQIVRAENHPVAAAAAAGVGAAQEGRKHGDA